MKYIKRILVLTTLSLLFSGIQITSAQETQKPAVPAATPAPRPQFRMPPRIVSPEILPDNKVTFRVYAKDATKVSVSGEWQAGFNASENLVKGDTGMFLLTVGPLKPELYGYTFNVDGVSTIDPNNVQVRRDGTRYASFFIIPGTESDLYVQKSGVPHGNVSKVWYILLFLEWTAEYMSIPLQVTKKTIRNILCFTCFTEQEAMRMHGLIWAELPK